MTAIALLAGACSAHPPSMPRSNAPSAPRSTNAHGTGDAPAPGGGTVLTRVIPGTTSGFVARPAMIYLPPVLREHPNTPLPTLELLHGLPGSPTDWLTSGHLLSTLNAFAAVHDGQAPIVVMPDINGSARTDTECISTPTANVEGYLTTDVENYVRAHFPASDRTSSDRTASKSARRWTIAGLSEGGTCAIMLALRHAQDYGLFGEFSGLPRPTLGDSDDAARTIKELFQGSLRQYDLHDPTWLMRRYRYPSLAGLFVCGASDRVGLASQLLLVRLARAAGITSTAATYPGGHDWRVWRRALPTLLQLIWSTSTH